MATATLGRFCHTRIVLASGANAIRWRDVGAATNYTATIAAGNYFLRGDGETSDTAALDLLAAIKTALDAAASAIVFTVSIAASSGASKGKITIAGTAAFNILWTDVLTTFEGEQIGFDDSADDTGASSYTSDNHAPGLWYPGVEGRVLDYDVRRVRSWQSALNGAVDVRSIASYGRRVAEYEYLGSDIIKSALGATNATFEDLWDDAAGGGSMVWYPDVDSTSTKYHVVVDEQEWGESLHAAAVPMLDAGGERYRVRIPMRDYVATS